MRLQDRIAPGSAVGSAGYRALMAAAPVRLVGRRDRASRAVATGLRATALGRIPPEERLWAARIEAWRSQLPAAVTKASAARGLDARDPDEPERLAEASRACQWMSLPPVWGRFLMRLVRELAPGSCLELGTGFGLSAAYQAAALELNGAGRILSLDIADMATLAEPGFTALELDHRVELLPGLIEESLPAALERAAPIDYVLLDADHSEQGTLAAFDAILPSLCDGAVVVLDDINWTEEMRRTWQAIRGRKRVSATVGLRRLGIAMISGSGEP